MSTVNQIKKSRKVDVDHPALLDLVDVDRWRHFSWSKLHFFKNKGNTKFGVQGVGVVEQSLYVKCTCGDADTNVYWNRKEI